MPSVSRQISSAVVLRWISGLAGFLNCCGMKYSGPEAAICAAISADKFSTAQVKQELAEIASLRRSIIFGAMERRAEQGRLRKQTFEWALTLLAESGQGLSKEEAKALIDADDCDADFGIQQFERAGK